VSQREGEDESAVADDVSARSLDAPDKSLLERTVSGKTNATALQMRTAEP
jgi:hypothetical protein